MASRSINSVAEHQSIERLSLAVGHHLVAGNAERPRAEIRARRVLGLLAPKDDVRFLEDVVCVGQAGNQAENEGVQHPLGDL